MHPGSYTRYFLICSAITKMFGKLDPEMVEQMMKAADTDGDGDVECVKSVNVKLPPRIVVLLQVLY